MRYLYFLIVVFIFGCKKIDNSPTSTIMGPIWPVSQFVEPMPEINFKVSLLLNGKEIKTITTSDKKYVFNNVKTGKYKMAFQHPDFYPDTIAINHDALVESYNAPPQLYQKATYKFSYQRHEYWGNTAHVFLSSTLASSKDQNLMIFLAKNKATLEKGFDHAQLGAYSPIGKMAFVSFQAFMTKSNIKKGDSFFVKFVPGIPTTKYFVSSPVNYQDYPFLVYENASEIIELKLP